MKAPPACSAGRPESSPDMAGLLSRATQCAAESSPAANQYQQAAHNRFVEIPPRRVGAPLGCRGIFSALRTRQMVDVPTRGGRAWAARLGSSVAPAVVLSGESLDEHGDLGAD